jgi:flagellum-specific ATP synthase
MKSLISKLQRNNDLISVGAYVAGTDRMLDEAIHLRGRLEQFLQQQMSEKISYPDSRDQLLSIIAGVSP